MFNKYSLSFVRKLRTVRRTGESSSRSRAASVPLSEDGLTKTKLLNVEEDLDMIKAEEESENKLDIKEKKIKLMDTILRFPFNEPLTEENQNDYITKAVTPLSLFPYQKQLRLKQKHCRSILIEMRKRLTTVKAPFSITREGLACPIEKIVPSPDVFSYRNMDKFSVHTGVDGNLKTVGHFIGLPRDPLMRCVNPAPLVNIRDSHKLVRTHFQKFIEDSHYKTCTNFKEGGVWRGLVVRSNLKGELMAVAIIYPNDLTCEEKEELKLNLHNYYFNGPGSECALSSLYLQACPHSVCSRETAPYELVGGEPYLTEECLGHTFRISPDSFFQSNTKGAELLFESVRKISELSTLTTLLDVCCGTGIISNLMASHCRGAVGIDSSSGAIEDAKINAQINGVKNVNYILGKAEKVLPVLSNDLRSSTDIVAVVNPARAGLHSSVIETIRSCQSINKIIYITCKPDGYALKNIVMLGSTLSLEKQYLRKIPDIKLKAPELYPPFALRYAIPIDLFPHTAHVEFVFLLERVENY